MRDELATLSVHLPSDVGWCAATPPNETTDAEGRPVVHDRGFSAADPRAPRQRSYDHPDVVALRDHLRANNGIRGLQIFSPDEVDEAAAAFLRDGFVVVRDVLDAAQLAAARQASTEALRRILEVPGVGDRKYLTETARLPHRYSYGTSSASRHLLHEPQWASLIDLPTTTPLLCRIFGTADYLVRGAGGDLCLPGAIEYQALHWDRSESYRVNAGRLAAAAALGVDVALPRPGAADDEVAAHVAALPHRIVDQVLEQTPAKVTINFLMSDLTWENGPIRQIPGTQVRGVLPPVPAEEPEWMRLSTLVGAPAGSAVFRDVRAWHGATPNLSREVRAMPNVEYQAAWDDADDLRQAMPHDLWETLSDHARRLCRAVVAPPGVWPAGAGVVHPLAATRQAASAVALPTTGESATAAT
jgi:ectoine hydroxylase-related dioxygenase (phytanoyl-CoA dioxygenase family)